MQLFWPRIIPISGLHATNLCFGSDFAITFEVSELHLIYTLSPFSYLFSHISNSGSTISLMFLS